MSQQVSIDVEFQQRAVDNEFELEMTVTSVSGGMESHIFLFNSQEETFMHVVRPSDLNWPESRDLNVKAYRKDNAVIRFNSMETLTEGRNRIEDGIQNLVDQFANDLASFLSTETVTFDPTS